MSAREWESEGGERDPYHTGDHLVGAVVRYNYGLCGWEVEAWCGIKQMDESPMSRPEDAQCIAERWLDEREAAVAKDGGGA